MQAGYERAGDGWRAILREGRRKVWACDHRHPRRYSRFEGDRSAVACACDELQRWNTTPERATEVKR
jgi:hypothetical protein